MTCYKEALADATEAIRLNPMNGRYYHGRSGILRRIARYEEALADITEAIKLEPTNAAYYKSRGTTLDVMNRYENALADYERAIALDATDAATYENRAETYHALADAAETDTQKAEYLRLAQADDDTAKALRSK
jgi:tetratricopeptide (TPR) repeat protein